MIQLLINRIFGLDALPKILTLVYGVNKANCL